MRPSTPGHEITKLGQFQQNQNCGGVNPWSIFRGTPHISKIRYIRFVSTDVFITFRKVHNFPSNIVVVARLYFLHSGVTGHLT